jgi:hypothetical protein
MVSTGPAVKDREGTLVMQLDDPIRPELASGEQLLWSGNPPTGIRLRGQDLFLIPFSLMWAGFAVFWEAMVLTKGAPLFFALWGIPFIAMGAYITVGRFFVDAQQRSKTTYAVTDQRVVIVSGLWSRQVKSLPLQTLSEISITEKSDSAGSGTITFGSMPAIFGWFAGTGWPGAGKHMPPSFEMISDVRNVYETIRTAQRAAK